MKSTSTTGRPRLMLVEPQPWYAATPSSALERQRELEDERYCSPSLEREPDCQPDAAQSDGFRRLRIVPPWPNSDSTPEPEAGASA